MKFQEVVEAKEFTEIKGVVEVLDVGEVKTLKN
jgi:hypothetical protein